MITEARSIRISFPNSIIISIRGVVKLTISRFCKQHQCQERRESAKSSGGGRKTQNSIMYFLQTPRIFVVIEFGKMSFIGFAFLIRLTSIRLCIMLVALSSARGSEMQGARNFSFLSAKNLPDLCIKQFDSPGCRTSNKSRIGVWCCSPFQMR